MAVAGKVSKYYTKILKGGRKDPDFFEFIRRIEQESGSFSVGKSSAFQDEPVYFGQMPSLSFPETSIAEISDLETLKVFVHFMGLCGTNGPLPLEYTSYIYQRAHNYYDFSPRRFQDIINHRFIALFYRAWKANEQAVAMDEEKGGLITAIIEALSGNSCTPKYINCCWSGIFGNAVKSRAGLELILQETTRLPVKIRENIPVKTDIPGDCRCYLGKAGVAELGGSIQIGASFYSCTRKMIIEIGPVSFQKCRNFLPGMNAYKELISLISNYLDRPLEYDLKFILFGKSLPEPELNGGHQLGVDLWLGVSPKEAYANLVIGASRLNESKHKKFYGSISKPI